MSNELATLTDRVRQKIKTDFVDIIPEALWGQMVDKVIADFVEKELPELVKTELRVALRKVIATQLGEPGFSGVWVQGRESTGPLMVEIIKQCAPELISQLFGGIARDIVMRIRNNQY